MSLHDKIMNLPQSGKGKSYEFGEKRDAYAAGHRDARHAAAEIASEYEATLAKLAEAVELLLTDPGPDYIKSSSWDKARAALASFNAIKEDQQ